MQQYALHLSQALETMPSFSKMCLILGKPQKLYMISFFFFLDQ